MRVIVQESGVPQLRCVRFEELPDVLEGCVSRGHDAAGWRFDDPDESIMCGAQVSPGGGSMVWWTPIVSASRSAQQAAADGAAVAEGRA